MTPELVFRPGRLYSKQCVGDAVVDRMRYLPAADFGCPGTWTDRLRAKNFASMYFCCEVAKASQSAAVLRQMRACQKKTCEMIDDLMGEEMDVLLRQLCSAEIAP